MIQVYTAGLLPFHPEETKEPSLETSIAMRQNMGT